MAGRFERVLSAAKAAKQVWVGRSAGLVGWRLSCLLGTLVFCKHSNLSGSPEEHVADTRSGGRLERWFMPTEIGHEPGDTPPPPGPRAFQTRVFYGSDLHDGGEWNARNRLDGRQQAFSHNLSRVFPVELFDQNPEFFPYIDGERWRPKGTGFVNWNPDLGEPSVAAHAAGAARRHFAQNPKAWSFALGVNDGLRFGESPATLRWVHPPRYFRGRPDYSDLVFNFMNRVAEQVSPEYPGKHLGALAYYWCEQVPSFPVHPKVMPFLTADRSQGYDAAFWQEEMALQQNWAKSGAERLGIYDYLYGYGFLVPRIHTALLADHLRHARASGFTDYFAEVLPHWGLSGPQPWLVAQLLLDPGQDERALLEEYYTRFYREGAEPMRRFFELCEALWMKQPGPSYWLKHYRSDTQASLFPVEARKALRSLLNEALLRVADDPGARKRVEITGAAFGVSERYVEMVEQRERLARAVMQAVQQGAAAPTGAIRALREADRESRARLVVEVERVRGETPLALGRVNLDDALRSDWGATADWVLEGGRETFSTAPEYSPNPRFMPPHESGLRIAGLLYEPGMPAGWSAKTEPWEGLVAELRSRLSGESFLRLENVKVGDFRTLILVPNTGNGVLSVELDGEVGPQARISLSAEWVAPDYRSVGVAGWVELPHGSWSQAILPLHLTGKPSGANAVLCRIWVVDQQAGDWLEISSPSLRWRADHLPPPHVIPVSP